LCHLILFFLCISFSVGTARGYVDENLSEREREAQNLLIPPNQRIIKLRFDKMIENSIDVMRVFCLLFCGPILFTECIMTMIFYSKIVNGCSEIVDPFTNILVYLLIIVTVASLSFFTMCLLSLVLCYKKIKDNWTDIVNYREQPSIIEDNEDNRRSS